MEAAARRTATLTITITGTNDAPVANADAATIAEDTVAPVTGNVLTNDTDVDGDALTVTTTGAQAGSLWLGDHQCRRQLQLRPG